MEYKQTRTPEQHRCQLREISKGLPRQCSGEELIWGIKQVPASKRLVKYCGCVTKIEFVKNMSQGCDKRKPA